MQQLIPLHDYQVYSKNFALTHPFCGLFLQMGLGKTSIILEMLWEIDPRCHVLIIAPKVIARTTWINEINKWHMNIRTKSLIVNDNGKQLTKAKRDQIYSEIPNMSPTVFFINREMVCDLVNHFNGTNGNPPWPFKIVIIDESQSFKSYTAARFKAMKSVRPYIHRLVLLTGSPTPKSLEDLWPQIYLLDMGQRLGQYITRYRETYFNPGIIVDNHPVTYRPKPGAEQQIYAKISDIVISMKNRYIKLPPITYNDVSVPMDPDEMKLYKTMMNDYVISFAEDTVVDAANAAVLSARLSQMASGALYTNAAKHEYEVIHRHKLEVCEYIINNTPGNIIIAYHFKSDLDMLMKYFKEVKIDAVSFDGSPEMYQKWNDGQIPVMMLQPASCGRGLNLQNGGSTLIWYTLPWSLEDYEQTNARIYRQGQKDPVVIHHLMTAGTIDSKILRALKHKDMTQQALISAVEVTINSAKNTGEPN